MKRLFFIIGITLTLLTMVTATSAINLGSDLTKRAAERAGYSGTTSETTFAEILGSIVKAVLSFVGIIFLSLMVYAGYLWMIARGDESKIERAQDIIRAAIIGLIITVGAYSITAFVVPRVLERTSGPRSGDQELGGPSVNCCRVCDTVSVLGQCQGNLRSEVVDNNAACQAICEGRENDAAEDCTLEADVPVNECQ